MNDFKALFARPIPSICTPFLPDGEIDYDHLAIMVERYLAWGNSVLMLTAGDSHYACLTERELAEVTFAVLKQVNRRAAVIVADHNFATNAAREFACETRRCGADCYMALPPDWGGSTTPETLAAHYREIGKILPVMCVTNFLAPRGPMGFGMELCRKLLEVPAVVAVKDDICGPFGRALASLLSDSKAVIAGGQKQNHLDLVNYGAVGYLSAFARFQPEVAQEYWNAITAGKLEVARQIVRRIDMPYFQLVGMFKGGFDAGLHGSLEVAGLARRHRRAPYQTITEDELEKLRDFHQRVPAILHEITGQ
ncbi:MAG: dihydrodipicolinate synthase family protein [Victivallales bacterium]|nr:dihydrodipicolinate synthase family protein [Victivallales bacterium]